MSVMRQGICRILGEGRRRSQCGEEKGASDVPACSMRGSCEMLDAARCVSIPPCRVRGKRKRGRTERYQHSVMPDRLIVVTGANGNVGAPLVDALAEQGISVRAAIHGAESAFTADVETVHFDFTDRQTWTPGFRDAQGLFVLRPPHLSNVETTIHPALDAAIAAGVGHVVTLSVMGAGANPFLPHRRIEKHVESQPVAWTHVRPGFYMQNLSGTHRAGICKHDEIIVPAGEGRANWVDTRDIGELAAMVLAEGAEHDKCIYEPTGPEALTYHAVAGILSDVLDRKIQYDRPGLWRYVQHMRRDTNFDLGFILFSCLLHTLVRLGRSSRVTDDVETVLGRPPRSLRDFAEDYADVWRS